MAVFLLSILILEVRIIAMAKAKSKKTQDITYCKESTLAETWISIIGEPRIFADSEGQLIIALAEKEFLKRKTPLQNVETISVFPKSDKPLDAFWYIQKKWSDGLFLSRFGHNFLSLHRLSKPEDPKLKYESFQISLLPEVKAWQKIISEGMRDEGNSPVKSISIGYLNQFKLPVKDFAIEDFFNVDIRAKVDTKASGIREVRLSLGFEEASASININLTINPVFNNIVPVSVETNVVSKNISNINFNNDNSVEQTIEELRKIARRIFFSFCSDKTIKAMKPVYKEDK